MIRGDLTPECATAVRAVLEALGKKTSPEDDRTEGQRFHDALQMACAPLPRVRPSGHSLFSQPGWLAGACGGGQPRAPRRAGSRCPSVPLKIVVWRLAGYKGHANTHTGRLTIEATYGI